MTATPHATDAAAANATADAAVRATGFPPPTPRDFEIHRLNRVENLSTDAPANRFKIPQTRWVPLLACPAVVPGTGPIIAPEGRLDEYRQLYRIVVAPGS